MKPFPPLHLFKTRPDDGDPVLDGGDGVWVAHGQDGLSHASSLVHVHPLLLHGAHEVPVRVQQRLQRLCLFGEDTAEAKRLLCLREPLQKHLHRRTKLFGLAENKSRCCHTERLAECRLGSATQPHLFQGLLEVGLLGHGQRAYRVPAVAKLLQLNFDPRRVVAARLHQLPSGTLQGLNVAGSLAQFLLESLHVLTLDSVMKVFHNRFKAE